MDIKKSLKDVIVLVVICVVFAGVLAATNSVTGPIIADRLNAAADEAYIAVMPGATGFEDVDLSQYTLPATVKEAKKEKSGMGYAVKLETTGYSTGMVIIVGVDSNGVVTGATCIDSKETWGLEKTFGEKVVGTNAETLVDVEAGATSLTINGYRNAVKDAINAATILGGGSVDIRTPEQILNDNLNSALGLTDCKFTKMFMVEVVDKIDTIYLAENDQGYVCVIGEGEDAEFIGVGTDGVALGDSENKAAAETAIATVTSTTLTDVDLTLYDGINKRIVSVKKTASGNYVVEVKGDGYGIDGSYGASGEYIVVKVSISVDGKVIDAQTLSHGETANIGGTHLEDGQYNSNFIGKTEDEAKNVDTVAGVTMTTGAFKKSVLRAFETIAIIEGGAN